MVQGMQNNRVFDAHRWNSENRRNTGENPSENSWFVVGYLGGFGVLKNPTPLGSRIVVFASRVPFTQACTTPRFRMKGGHPLAAPPSLCNASWL